MNILNYIPNLICFTGKAERAQPAIDELKRVGFRDVNVHWAFPNPFDKVLLRSMPHTKMFDDCIGFFNCSRMHYRIVKIAYELGREWVMVCEDDCSFLKDVNIVKEMADAPDADVYLLDVIPPAVGFSSVVPVGDGRWSSFKSMRSGACYILSRKAMKRIIWLYESAIDKKVNNRKARICDQWFDRRYLGDLKILMATPNIAVQQTIAGDHNSGNAWRLRGYDALGIDLSKYED